MPTIENHYTMPTKDDPLFSQPLKLPQSVMETFRAVAALEGRTIQWLMRNELTGAASRFSREIKLEGKSKPKSRK